MAGIRALQHEIAALKEKQEKTEKTLDTSLLYLNLMAQAFSVMVDHQEVLRRAVNAILTKTGTAFDSSVDLSDPSELAKVIALPAGLERPVSLPDNLIRFPVGEPHGPSTAE